MNNPLVTVIISTYNRPEWLKECVESVFAQAYQNYEVLLFQDGGAEIDDRISRWGRQTDNLKIFPDTENKGFAHRLNQGLAIAKGKYLCYIGDDDKYYPNHIETLVKVLEENPGIGGAYSDLYRTDCIIHSDKSREVIAKTVVICRDFDKVLMLQYNNILGMSIMHRTDLVKQAGGWREDNPVLIDWDINRKLVFNTIFKHVNVITGEYYCPVEHKPMENDRISKVQRNDHKKFLHNLLKIRNTKPPKPWKCLKEVTILIETEQYSDRTTQLVKEIYAKTIWPYRTIIPLPASQCNTVSYNLPNFEVVPVVSPGVSERINEAVTFINTEWVAILPEGFTLDQQSNAWIEKACCCMEKDDSVAYWVENLADSTKSGILCTKELFEKSRRFNPTMNTPHALIECGISIYYPNEDDWPFQFDDILKMADNLLAQGKLQESADLLDYCREHFKNDIWMLNLAGMNYYQMGEFKKAMTYFSASLDIEDRANTNLVFGKCMDGLGQNPVKFYEKAAIIIEN